MLSTFPLRFLNLLVIQNSYERTFWKLFEETLKIWFKYIKKYLYELRNEWINNIIMRIWIKKGKNQQIGFDFSMIIMSKIYKIAN